ncbi:UbiA prenyltransferase family protein [Theileria parva strain Muguga]|uniref:4-hydroxybenzoate polyprenyltransferase, mitochondrial n=1 Tax=Theileria parva TaxID=5875 RepID=Q4MYN9_THEPA|nr:UbiA prenyltransferase family protein [Theileria parva strain Muguga]EAN30643.1 UbiA prenyltransferase family protein [Theileria parva strain Muguga]|eukprot:XP_762926.1 4-hydroxybenzoate octaprenyltransferase [Theileria parva strain Muguga]
MFSRRILFNVSNIKNSLESTVIYRSFVPKLSKDTFGYNFINKLYITTLKNDKIISNNKSPTDIINNTLNHSLLTGRYITINNAVSKDNGLYDKIISCGRLMRVHTLMPVVIFALPAMWSAALALPPVVTFLELKKIALLCLGAFSARSAGCCVNDLADRNFDKLVQRTKIRPLASGSINTTEALITLMFNSTIALTILYQFDPTTIGLGLLTGVTCSIYPFMKRYIKYPQLILGLSSSIGTLMAWTAISGNPLTMAPLCIYLTSSLWSLIYDTVYAHQDKNDDIKLGLGSLAIEWGDKTKKMCNIVAYNMSILMATCGYLAHLTDLFYVSVVISHLWMLREIKKVDLSDPANCLLFFKKTTIYGGLLLLGIILGKPELKFDFKSEKSLESTAS